MDEAEFDKFAEEYTALSEEVLGVSGEDSEFFAEYKVRDTRNLLRELKCVKPPKILDFGSGIGTSVPWLHKYFPQSPIHCLDVSRKSLAISEHRFPQMADFHHFDGKTLPFPDESMDLVFSACVFHHIPPANHLDIIRELRRVLKPGGVFISFEHNPYNPLTTRAVKACRYDENAILIPANTFRHRLLAAGFPDSRYRYRIFFPRALRFFRPLEKWLTKFPLGAQYYVYAQKPA